MRRGAKGAACLNDVDQSFELSARQRLAVLEALFDAPSTQLDKWRVRREKSAPGTLWALVRGCFDDFGAALRRDVCAPAELLPEAARSKSGDDEVLVHSLLSYSLQRLSALRAKVAFDEAVDGVLPAPEDARGGAVACPLCMDDFNVGDVVSCSSAADFHAVCRPCFRQLCIQFASDKGTGPSAVACPVPKCGSLFSARDVRGNVSAFDLMTMDEREREASLRAALGATAAILRCVCGAVGAVSESDLGDGVVSCPGVCGRSYCAKCGNAAHPNEPCPAPSDMLKWLEKKTKKCPKCKESIEKDSGCNHMTCRCGAQFCWLCLGPFPNCNCGHFEAESQRAANDLQRRDAAGFMGGPRGAYGWAGGGARGWDDLFGDMDDGDSDDGMPWDVPGYRRRQRGGGRPRGRQHHHDRTYDRFPGHGFRLN